MIRDVPLIALARAFSLPLGTGDCLVPKLDSSGAPLVPEQLESAICPYTGCAPKASLNPKP